MKNNRFYQKTTVFQGRYAPEEGYVVGYGAIINAFHLEVPYPDTLSLISLINHKNIYQKDDWQVYPLAYLPEDDLFNQLVFAIRYEGINLLFFKKLFAKLSEKEIIELVQLKPLGQYCRKIWFLYEWLENKQLEIPDLKAKSFVPIINPKLQFGIENGNQSNVDMTTVFVGEEGNSTDGQYQLKQGSPAIGAGYDGEDCGAFGGATPYILSGLPAIPAIYFFISPAVGSSATGLSVQIKAKAHN